MTLKRIIAKPISVVLILFFLSLFIRVIWLDKIPAGIVNDNMIFVLNAKAVFYTGKDLSGLWHPLKFAPIPDEPPQAELPYVLMAPIIGILPSSLFSAHIFHAVINSFFVIVFFLIVLRLLGTGPAIIAGLIACFNPWNIFFGRSAFEVSLALFFYVLGFYILLVTTGWKKLLAVLPLAGGFYTYMAYKLTFIPYAFAIAFFTWAQIDRKRYTKQFVIFFLLCLFIFFSFLVNVKNQTTASRLSELSFFSASAVESQVNVERRVAIKNPLSTMFSNKATLIAKNSIAKYIGAFSPTYLFVNNEWILRFNIYNHGYFYYLDFVFFLLGFCYLFAYKRKLWSFLMFILLIAPIPSVVSNVDISYAMRSSLYIPFFYIFIASGIWYTLTLFKNKKYFIIVTIVTSGLYAILTANFLYTYFFLAPIQGSEGTAFSQRLVAHYANFANQAKIPLVVISNEPKELFKDFVFYSDSYNRQTAQQFRNAFLNHTYSFQNVSFHKCSEVKSLEEDKIYISDPRDKCPLFKDAKQSLSIVQLSDSGTVYAIYQDSLCSQYSPKPYIANLTLTDFDLNKLSLKEFCDTFIVDYEK